MSALVYHQEVTARVVEVTDEGDVIAEAVTADHDDPINFGQIDATVGEELRAQIKGHTGSFYAAFPYSSTVRPDDYEIHGKDDADEQHRKRQQKQRDERLLSKIREQRGDDRGGNTGTATDESDTARTNELRGLAVEMGIEETTEEQNDPHTE